ncbi:MAG: hypothetical protein JXJ17_03980 [Anaerolineae bacterium]|nr:hypothetical protein [Anaerolineae bacterium]
MKRLFIVMVLLSAIAFSIVGCDGAPEPTPTSPPAVVEPTDAPEPTPIPTDLPAPTDTPEPAPTDEPVPTDEPAEEPVGIETPTPIIEVDGQPIESSNFAPSTNSVWNITPTSSTMSGSCAGGDVIDFCASMVALAPAGGSLTWRGQDGNTYTLSPVEPNHYQGGGPAFLRGFTLAINVTFIDAGAMSATYTLTPDDDPTCNYIYQYQGTLAW